MSAIQWAGHFIGIWMCVMGASFGASNILRAINTFGLAFFIMLAVTNTDSAIVDILQWVFRP